MTPQDFCYWLQGFLEMSNPTTLNEQQTQMLKDHMDLVMTKITPNRNTSISIYTPPELEPQMTKVCSAVIKEQNKSHEPTASTYDYVGFIGTCPLMHPTCSRNHYSRDPNNTPEEREKLLAWEKNRFSNGVGFANALGGNITLTTNNTEKERMVGTLSQSQIKCEYEEKYGYRCVNHKHLDKIGTKAYDYGDSRTIAKTNEDYSISMYKVNEGSTYEEAKTDLFKHATPITPGSEQYYRNIKCNMTC